MGEALSQAGRWRANELALESLVPVTAATGATAALYSLCAPASGASPLSMLELGVLLSAVAGLVAWAAARQLYLSGDRRVGRAILIGLSAVFATIPSVGGAARSAFDKTCAGELGGEVHQLAPEGWLDVVVCQAGGVPGSAALRGTIYRSRWGGQVPVVLWPVLGLVGALASIGLRSRRIRPTSVPQRLSALLTRLPAAGLASAIGDPLPKDGRVVACANRTWWGASCGQLYSADRAWRAGEWCRRCRLPFRPYPHSYPLDVVLPVTSDLATLNAMERVDAVSWTPGSPLRTLGSSLTGTPRWIRIGSLNVPAILPVSQVIALATDLLPTFATGATPEVAAAIGVAKARASRICAWLWGGDVSARLHLATPTRSMMLIGGGRRLRDLVGAGSGRLSLQLDVGVLPIEVRAGYVHRLLPESREEAGQPWSSLGYVAGNLQYTTWIGTRPEQDPASGPGVWVPRLEGVALRRWLIRERPPRSPKLPQGATRPAPYVAWKSPLSVRPKVGLIGVTAGELAEVTRFAPVDLRTVSGHEDPSLVELDLVMVRVSANDAAAEGRLSALRQVPGAPELMVMSDDQAWPPSRLQELGLRAWMRLPLEPGDAEELGFQAVDAARDRLARPPIVRDHDAPEVLDYVLTPLRGQQHMSAGPSEPTLQVQAGLESGEPEDLEPELGDALPMGAALAEWDWFEPGQIDRLRREVVVLRKTPPRGSATRRRQEGPSLERRVPEGRITESGGADDGSGGEP